jgi:hypothetical protein
LKGTTLISDERFGILPSIGLLKNHHRKCGQRVCRWLGRDARGADRSRICLADEPMCGIHSVGAVDGGCPSRRTSPGAFGTETEEDVF